MRTWKSGALVALAVTVACGSMAPAAQALASSWTLHVTRSGNGYVSGTGPIDCGATCDATINNDCAYDPSIGHVVCDEVAATETATNANGYTFQSWSGCDSTSGTGNAICQVSGLDSATITANFADTQAPTVGLTSPSAGVKSGNVTLSATANDNSGAISKVEFYVRGALVGTDTSAPYSVSLATGSLSDGTAAVAAKSYDATGNASSLASVTITIDNLGPTFTNVFGPDGSTTYGPNSTQTFSWVASDAGSGVASVQCKLDSGAFGACSGGAGGQSYTDLAPGQHTFTVRATDNASHVTDLSRSWLIDATGPTVGNVSPAGGSTVRGTLTFATDATDASGMQRVEFWLGGVKVAEDTTEPFGVDVDTTGHPDGLTAATVKAFDFFGNETDSTDSVTIDNTAPSLTFGDGPDGATFAPGTTQTWSFTAADATSGVAAITCSVDDATFGACTSSTGETVTGAGAGAHTMTVRVVDNAGNAQTFKRTWTIAAAGPAGGSSGDGGATGGGQTADGGSPSSSVPAVRVQVRARWRVVHKRTRVLALALSRITSGAKVTVACAGKGCPFTAMQPRVRRGAVNMTAAFTHPLAPGIRITVTVRKAGMRARRFVWTTRANATPKATALTVA